MPDLLELLPEVIRSTARPGSPLAALDAAGAGLLDPVVEVLERLDAVVDPYRSPPHVVRYLSSWVDLAWAGVSETEAGARAAGSVTTARLRDLVAASADLSARRGTPAGMARFLHLATGVDGFEVRSVPGAFHVQVVVPPAAAGQTELVEHLVRALRPAHVTSEVLLSEQVAQPPSRPAGDAPLPPPPPPPPTPPSASPPPPGEGGAPAPPRRVTIRDWLAPPPGGEPTGGEPPGGAP